MTELIISELPKIDENWRIEQEVATNQQVMFFMGMKLYINPEQEDALKALQCWANLYKSVQPKQPIIQMLKVSDADRKILKKLCHPDKHGGSKQAEEMFKKINGNKL